MLRKKYAIVVLLLISMFNLTGCKNEMEDDHQTMKNSSSIQTQKPQDNKESKDQLMNVGDSEWDMDVLRSTLKINEEMEILFQYDKDFDNDNNEEIIIAFGDDYIDEKDCIEDIYYIENINGDYEILSHIQSERYGTFSIELINLVGMDLPVLYCRKTNYANLIGFELYEIKDKALKQLVYSASAAPVGCDEMTDMDANGIYHGFVEKRSCYDTLYTDLRRYYEFIDGKFEIKYISAFFYNYPDTPEKVVLQYLNMHSLKQVEELEIPDIEVRLRELCPSNFEPPILYDYNVMVKYNMLFEGALEFNTKIHEETNIAEVNVIYNEGIDKSKVVYSLGKTDDKWIINDCKVLD